MRTTGGQKKADQGYSQFSRVGGKRQGQRKLGLSLKD